MQALLLRALPYRDAGRLVMVWEDATFYGFPKNTPAPGNFYEWKAQSTVFSESGAVSASPDATLELNVQRLDEDASGNLVLQAQASVDFKRRSGPVLRSFRFVVPPPSADIQGEVTAISFAISQLADGLASVLVSGR